MVLIPVEQLAKTPYRKFHYWKNPAPDTIGSTSSEFLHKLPGPTHIHVPGRNSNRRRAVATLLHGNEASGLHAVFEVLRQKIVPAVDIHYFIPSVDAARQAPGFIYRMLPDQKDLNRCFKEPFDDTEQDQLAQELLTNLERINPECVIDIHNTSSSSPSFGVATFMDERHDSLVSLFTNRLIVTDLILGSLMEISQSKMQVVTKECGGTEDSKSNQMASEGLLKYITHENVLLEPHTDMSFEVFHNPVRVELRGKSEIAYGHRCLLAEGVTLLPDIDNFNFGYVQPENCLGFVSGNLATKLTVIDINRQERVLDYLRLSKGALYPTRRLRLFMATTNPEIARKDCLFYLIEA